MDERPVGHDRAEVAAADPDVDHVADALAGGALPRAAADLLREPAHATEHLVDLRDHVLAVDLDHRVLRRPQGHVQHRAVLGDVDLLALEHGGDALLELRPLREGEEQPHRLGVHMVLGVVHPQPGALDGEAIRAATVLGEEVAEGAGAGLLRVGREGLPLGRAVDADGLGGGAGHGRRLRRIEA